MYNKCRHTRMLFHYKVVGFIPCFQALEFLRNDLVQVQSMRPHKFADGRNPNNQCLGRQR